MVTDNLCYEVNFSIELKYGNFVGVDSYQTMNWPSLIRDKHTYLCILRPESYWHYAYFLNWIASAPQQIFFHSNNMWSISDDTWSYQRLPCTDSFGIILHKWHSFVSLSNRIFSKYSGIISIRVTVEIPR